MTPKGEDEDANGIRVPAAHPAACHVGEQIERGTPVNEGPLAPAELLDLRDDTETARYLVEQVQEVYTSQGVEIHDKHIELIVRQMLKKVRIDTPATPSCCPAS